MVLVFFLLAVGFIFGIDVNIHSTTFDSLYKKFGVISNIGAIS